MELASYLCQRARIPLPPRLKTLDASQRLSIVAKTIYLETLFQMGGGLAQSIPQQGHLQRGRLWDLGDSASLSLSPSVSSLLAALERALHKDGSSAIPIPYQDAGDVFFFHMIAKLLAGQQKLQTFASKLLICSPLTRLCHSPLIKEHPAIRLPSQEEGIPAILHEEAEQLQSHPALGFFSAYIADQWSRLPSPDAQAPLEQQIQILRTWQATLLLWMETCARTGRLSLLSAFPMWWSRLLAEHFVEKVLEIQEFRNLRMSQREALIFCYADLLRLGDRLETIIEQHITRPGPYGWENPEEVRAFLGAAGRHWTSGGLQEQVNRAQHRLRRVLN